jgi:hypothetical protein
MDATEPVMVTPSQRAHGARGPLYVLKGTRLDMSDSLAGDAKLDGELVQGKRRIIEPARLEDVVFAVVKNVERHAKRPSAGFRFFAFGETRFLFGTFLYQCVLPLGRIILLVHWRIEGNVTAHAPVHLNNVPFGNAKCMAMSVTSSGCKSPSRSTDI